MGVRVREWNRIRYIECNQAVVVVVCVCVRVELRKFYGPICREID